MTTDPATGFDDLPLTTRLAVDRVCTEYEVAVRAGAAPDVWEFVTRLPEPARRAGLREMLLVEKAAEGRVGGRYELGAELGRGGMAVVFRARDTRLGRGVALKLVRADRHSAELTARLRHPNVVQVFEVGTHEGRPFLALELLDGGTLAARLLDGPLAPSDAARVVEALARAVAEAHRVGVVHRDLKPANVLLHDPHSLADPKVADFGLARPLDPDATLTDGGSAGTPAYMSPEQAAGTPAGAPADVYALGVILYECLAGALPFAAGPRGELLRRIIVEPPVAPGRRRRGVPAELDAVCLKCLAKEPRERYATAALLAADLRGRAGDRGGGAGRGGRVLQRRLPRPPRTPGRRHARRAGHPRHLPAGPPRVGVARPPQRPSRRPVDGPRRERRAGRVA